MFNVFLFIELTYFCWSVLTENGLMGTRIYVNISLKQRQFIRKPNAKLIAQIHSPIIYNCH